MTISDAQLSLPIRVASTDRQERNPRPAASAAVRRRMNRWGATEVFDLYWRFAGRRQRILERRLAGSTPPWTDDPILARHRFTNPYRLSDRVSQYLLRRVQYDRPRPVTTIILRTLLFKVFNRIDTWESLVAAVGEPTTARFDPAQYEAVLSDLRKSGRRIYSPAYIVPNPPFDAVAKHGNHLRLIAWLIERGVVDNLARAGSLRRLFEILQAVPSFGPFLAFQYAVDINYSAATVDGESGFVVAGPGAKDGLRKCFASLPAGSEHDAILWVAETQHDHFGRLGIEFPFLAGRALQPIDCQNLFCEVDKYARISHPHITGRSGRTRIKQVFEPTGREPLAPLFVPPKWTPGSGTDREEALF